jgi:hypothetical protein
MACFQPGHLPGKLKKCTNNLSQNSRCHCRDSNQGYPNTSPKHNGLGLLAGFSLFFASCLPIRLLYRSAPASNSCFLRHHGLPLTPRSVGLYFHAILPYIDVSSHSIYKAFSSRPAYNNPYNSVALLISVFQYFLSNHVRVLTISLAF